MMNNVLLTSILVLCHAVNAEATAPVCPEEGAISLAHSDTGVGGETYLTCSFNFPPNMLYFYQWFIRDNHEVIYYYLANEHIGELMPKYESIIKNESHVITNTTGSSTLALRKNSDPEIIYMCKVFLQNHDQCSVDTTALTKVCPDPESMRLTQASAVPRPGGSVELICEFRVARGQMDYYQWSVGGQIVPKYIYPSSDPNERHRIDESGGKSTLIVHSRLEDSHFTFTCQVILRDGWNCSRNLSLLFKAPDIGLSIHEKPSTPNQHQVIACTIYDFGGIPNISIDVVSESYRNGIDVHSHSYKKGRHQFTKYVELTMDEPGLVTCNVTDSKGHYSINRYIPPAECPGMGSVIVLQENLVQRPSGPASITCHFRVVMAKLLKYSWIKQTDVVLDFWMTDKVPRMDSMTVKNEYHKFYADGGFSTIIITSKYGRQENFICEATMIDKEHCAGSLLLKLEDPELAIDIYGGTQHSSQVSKQDHGTFVCGASYTEGLPNMTLLERHPTEYSEELVVTPIGRNSGLYNASLYVHIHHRQDNSLTCLVVDNTGTFKKTISRVETVYCPANAMDIKQSYIVRRTGDVLSMSCRFRGPVYYLQELYWVYGSHKGLLYEYRDTGVDTTEVTYLGNVSSIMDGDEIISNLRLNTTEFHDSAIACVSRWRDGGSCLVLQRIAFLKVEPPYQNQQDVPMRKVWPFLLLIIGAILAITIPVAILYYKKKTVQGSEDPEQHLFEEAMTEVDKGIYFKDPTFPATHTSVGGISLSADERNKLKWKRPWEIYSQLSHDKAKYAAMLPSDDLGVEDIIQGRLKNGWLLASLGAVATTKKLKDNFKSEGDLTKSGVHEIWFRLWTFGEWQYIRIDDCLPTLNNKLIFAQSAKDNVFGVALLEKAFAKIYGSYQNLEGIGLEVDIMADLTGGIVAYHKTPPTENKEELQDLLTNMTVARDRSYPMICATAVCPERKGKGLKIGAGNRHFYTITGLGNASDESCYKVTLHDPSMYEEENCQCLTSINTSSPGSSYSAEALNEERIQKLEVDFNTFAKVFEQVHICYIPCNEKDETNENGPVDISKQGLRTIPKDGKISALCDGYTEGVREYMPQYLLKTTSNQCALEVMIGVLQKTVPPKTSLAMKWRSLNIYIWKIKCAPRTMDAFTANRLDTEAEFVRKFSGLKRHREQGGRVTLSPGVQYVLIIQPKFMDVEIEYLVRFLIPMSSDLQVSELQNPDGPEKATA